MKKTEVKTLTGKQVEKFIEEKMDEEKNFLHVGFLENGLAVFGSASTKHLLVGIFGLLQAFVERCEDIEEARSTVKDILHSVSGAIEEPEDDPLPEKPAEDYSKEEIKSLIKRLQKIVDED